MNKKLMRDLVKIGEYREKSRFELIYNSAIYSLGFGVIAFLGSGSNFFLQNTPAYLATVVSLYGVGVAIAGIGIHNENKRIKKYFREHHNMDITTKDLSKENIAKIKKELSESDNKEYTKDEEIITRVEDNQLKTNNSFKFTGYENHSDISINKTKKMKKD